MNTINTAGYQGSSPDILKGYVDSLGAILIDIRFRPYSRDPRWNQAAIRNLVGDDRYLWMHELGNTNYKSGGPIHLYQPHLAVPRIRQFLAQQPVILLCCCWNVETCHRKNAAEYLAEQLGAGVEHLPSKPSSLSENTIRSITLTQPWASLMEVGAKRNETRSWKTDYRGPLAIHAAKGLAGMSERGLWELCRQEPFRTALARGGYTAVSLLPRGAFVATCELVDCVRTEDIVDSLSEEELAFGDYSPGRWTWITTKTKKLWTPIPARGALGLWSVDAAVLEAAS
jgi:hypothetical protein